MVRPGGCSHCDRGAENFHKERETESGASLRLWFCRQNAALQATEMGIVAHGMAGFDFVKARTALNVPNEFDVGAMFALGRPGDPGQLPPNYREMEVPSQRRPIRESVCEGQFNFVESTAA